MHRNVARHLARTVAMRRGSSQQFSETPAECQRETTRGLVSASAFRNPRAPAWILASSAESVGEKVFRGGGVRRSPF